MARTLHKFVNTIGWRLDRQSWNSVLKNSRRMGKELGDAPTASMVKASRRQEKELIASRTKLADKLRREDAKIREQNKRQAAKDSKAGFQSSISGLTETSGLKASQTLFAERMRQEDALAKKRTNNQKTFEKTQQKVLKRFVQSTAAIRDLSVIEKKVLLSKLKQAKTTEDLLHLEKRLKNQVTDRQRKEKARTRELQKQQGISKNLAANLAGAYAGVMSGHAVVQTGLTFESLERSMLVTSGSAVKAKENFKFVREEALRLGLDIQNLTSAYVQFQAAAGNKLSQADLRQVFVGISEASTALGLSQEKQQRVFTAATQIISKGRVQSEELVGQLSESLGISTRAMTSAAVEIGKISRNLTPAEQEQQLRKLMERGEILAHEIMPQFGKELSKIANANDQLAWSLRTGLQPQLSIAQTNIKEITNSFFSGLKPALMAITKSFNLLAGEGKGLAKVIGTGLGSAIKAASFPFAMLGALCIDLYNAFKDLTGATDEGITKFATFGAKVLGLSYGITKLIRGFKLLWNIGSKVVGFFTGAGATASGMAKGVTSLNMGLRGTLGLFTRLNPYIASLMAIWESRPGGSMSFTSLFGDSETAKWWDTPVLEHLRRTGKEISSNQKVDVNLNIVSDVNHNGNIVNTIRSEIDNDRENQMINFYSNLSPSSN
ncbi:tape measure protein [Vibrio alginolyticus]